jgi:hypothetical protein
MTQGQRQDFNWRPNDYSVQTRTRYDLEMGHWLESFRGSVKSGSVKTTSSLSEMFGYFGLFVSLFINLLTLLILILIDIINWLRKLFTRTRKLSPEEMYKHLPKTQEWLTKDELDEMWDNMDENTETINIRDLNEES